ncbi:hypothetical protein [Nonomuraea sp. GTA35]|uniref:hypothetical protein n=1 Tax=Nonomuraea sp. GTA35 TaxID=1676746 RepID=UPI0035C08271
MSLVVSQPSTVDSLFDTAVQGGATILKPPTKSFWGYGGVLRDPYGTIWKIASSAKKDAGVSIEGTGSHRLIIGTDAGTLTDPDGFTWEATSRSVR